MLEEMFSDQSVNQEVNFSSTSLKLTDRPKDLPRNHQLSGANFMVRNGCLDG